MQIDTVLFDLDDTLISTHKLFTKEIRRAIRLISKETGNKYKDVKKFVDEEIINSYGKAKVNPMKTWAITISEIQKRYKLSKSIKDQITGIFLGIYKRKPQRKRGVITLLKRLKRNGIKIGLVTHASKEWTHFKLEVTNLLKYFEYIEIVDTNRAKTGKDWVKGLNKLKAKKESTIVVGDNINGDIISSYNEGFRNLVWIKRVGAWKVYSQGEVPKGTKVIPHISKLNSILK